MRRSASEILDDLESRIARLEKEGSNDLNITLRLLMIFDRLNPYGQMNVNEKFQGDEFYDFMRRGSEAAQVIEVYAKQLSKMNKKVAKDLKRIAEV